MKRIIIAVLMVLIYQICFSQIRIGVSKNELINKDFYDKVLSKGRLSDGAEYISWSDNNLVCTYSFDEYGNCDYCIITPKNNVTLNGLIEKYNKNYVIVSYKSWNMYSMGAGSIVKIDMVTLEGITSFVARSKKL